MLTTIIPSADHAEQLAELGRKTFLESHGNSASQEDLQDYIKRKFTAEQFGGELSDPGNIFRLVYAGDTPAGYSKIILSAECPDAELPGYAKMERLYVLQEFFPLKIGQQLFDLNVKIAAENKSRGLWLNVWTENHRAIRFYIKQGFEKAGDTYFEISPRHRNPNYVMKLSF